MTGQQIITVAAIFIALASAGASSCQVKRAEEAARIARSETETLRGRLEDVEAENAELREILARAHEAVNRASKAVEEIFLPRWRLKKYNPSFSATAATSTAAKGRENATGVGAMIFSREDFPSSTPMTTISAATARPERYSNRA